MGFPIFHGASIVPRLRPSRRRSARSRNNRQRSARSLSNFALHCSAVMSSRCSDTLTYQLVNRVEMPVLAVRPPSATKAAPVT